VRFYSGKFEFKTYNQVYDLVKFIGSGMRSMGVAENANVGLYSINRPEWVIYS
jgi:long-chain acyl-CoA synthetase